MKKLSLLVAGLMMVGATYAGEGKACCKKNESCKKEASAKCADKKDGEAKACCQKKGEKTAENAPESTTVKETAKK